MSSAFDKRRIIAQVIRQNPGRAICYSGYREGQDPRRGIFPSEAEIREDLLMLADFWSFIRLYDCSQHAETTLKVIRDEGLPLRVMLGVDLAAEMSNPNCPWGAEFSDETLSANRQLNRKQVERLMALANAYRDIVFAVSVGNEASVEWTDHMVSVDSLVAYTRRIKSAVSQPVTFCENYVPWVQKLQPLVAELDFLSVHTYPVWEYRTIDDALAYTKQNYDSVARHFPDKPIVISEAGWTTASNGRGIDPANASEAFQAEYYEQLMAWTTAEKILTFVFEAFDEPWKGSSDPQEPEKHWGLFYVDRTPKLVMQRHAPGAD
ncbi:glycosyl hydrolase family 17 protein [Candidatus Amarolinea aalborgensis]|uniref:glycoside hydrolase family 17 protein n=1 Tax=Candidatus Amarolinea aalborgensis TaxID=2249329 RepID=UPI003BF9B4EA